MELIPLFKEATVIPIANAAVENTAIKELALYLLLWLKQIIKKDTIIIRGIETKIGDKLKTDAILNVANPTSESPCPKRVQSFISKIGLKTEKPRAMNIPAKNAFLTNSWKNKLIIFSKIILVLSPKLQICLILLQSCFIFQERDNIGSAKKRTDKLNYRVFKK